MGSLDESGDLGVANCEDGGATGSLHRSNFEVNLARFVKLAAIHTQSMSVILVSQIYHVCLVYNYSNY